MDYATRVPSSPNLVRSFLVGELREELVDLGGYGRGRVDGVTGDGQLEGAVAFEGLDQEFKGIRR